jgi:putative DNA primase/helicase
MIERAASIAVQDGLSEVARLLATCDREEYLVRRKREARRFDVPVSKLDELVREAQGEKASATSTLPGRAADLCDPEPWPEPIDGAALLDNITREIARFMVLPTHALVAIALWIMFTFAIDAAEHAQR